MAASVYKVNATGAVAFSSTATVPAGRHYRLSHVTLNLDAAPTTSENMTITLDMNAGAEYDVLLYSVDLSVASTTDVVWWPDDELYLEPGDAVTVAYGNTDLAIYGVQITMEAV